MLYSTLAVSPDAMQSSEGVWNLIFVLIVLFTFTIPGLAQPPSVYNAQAI